MKRKSQKSEDKKGRLGLRCALAVSFVIALLVLGHFLWWFYEVRDYHSPVAELKPLTTLSPNMPAPEDFILEIQDESAVTVEYVRVPDLSVEGAQEVTLLLTDEWENTAQVQTILTVIIDSEAPVISGVQDHHIYLGHELNFMSGVSVSDDVDESPVLTVDSSGVDLSSGGSYEIIYTAVDESGNESTVISKVTITDDRIAPTILGVSPISLYAGSTVAYRSGILVFDDQDESPVLTVDSSAVDLSQPGTYELVYTAVDDAGNETSITTTVTVAEKADSYVEEETVHEAADEILARIVTEDMTNREKVEAVYRWIKRNCTYTGTSDKKDWLQAAYTMMTRHSGDCFNYYAVSKLMFDHLGLPNLTVMRSGDSVREGSHYWNLVSIDGGETWYHFDTTPRSIDYAGNRNFCLVTDSVLDAYDRYFPGYYTRDRELYPATPAE